MSDGTNYSFSYPPVSTQYTVSNAYTVIVNASGASQVTVTGLLNPTDTTSLFNLNGPPPTGVPVPPATSNAALYILPGLPFNASSTPNAKLLYANASSGGTAVIAPPDYGLLPNPLLADFLGIVLQNVGDYANIIWNGFLWSVVDVSPGAAVLSFGQSLP